MNETITYPQYRKYLNGKVYFKIISNTEWEEIQQIGKKFILNSFTSKILPDRNFLHDLIYNYEENCLDISKTEYEEVKKQLP